MAKSSPISQPRAYGLDDDVFRFTESIPDRAAPEATLSFGRERALGARPEPAADDAPGDGAPSIPPIDAGDAADAHVHDAAGRGVPAQSGGDLIGAWGLSTFDPVMQAKGGKGGGKPTSDTDSGGGGGGKGGGKGGKPDKGDGGTTDGGTTDGETGDGGTTDGGTTDGGTTDGGTSDGGATDGGTSDGGTGLLTSYLSGGDAASSFNIEVVFYGTWTTALQDAFVSAADYLSTIITGDIADAIYQSALIDDVRIDAQLTSIDGSGGVLGQAGPTVFRSGSYLPVAGVMEFDSADAETFDASGLFDDVVLHEMIHVLGFGTLWGLMGLTSGSVAGDDLVFTGENANAAYQAEFGGTTLIPVETGGGAGTAGGHWDEAVFDDEIMTGFIDSSNYLSATSIAALEDMGYETIWDPADPAAGGGELFV